MYDNANEHLNGKSGKIELNFPLITKEDLNFPEGKQKKMVEMPRYKLGKTRAETRIIIASL